MKSVRLIAVWLLLLALPVQGLAAFTPSARCSDEHAAHAVQAVNGAQHDHPGDAAHGHEHAADQQQPDSGQPVDQAGGHACCHHVFSAAPAAIIAGVPAAPHVVNTRVLLLATLYIPELPQRPPRA